MRRAGCPPRLGIRRSLIVRGVSPHLRHHHFLLIVDKLEVGPRGIVTFLPPGQAISIVTRKPMPIFLVVPKHPR